MLYDCTGFVDVYFQVAGVYCYVGSHKIALNTILIGAGTSEAEEPLIGSTT